MLKVKSVANVAERGRNDRDEDYSMIQNDVSFLSSSPPSDVYVSMFHGLLQVAGRRPDRYATSW